jgi:hypothetical protein
MGFCVGWDVVGGRAWERKKGTNERVRKGIDRVRSREPVEFPFLYTSQFWFKQARKSREEYGPWITATWIEVEAQHTWIDGTARRKRKPMKSWSMPWQAKTRIQIDHSWLNLAQFSAYQWFYQELGNVAHVYLDGISRHFDLWCWWSCSVWRDFATWMWVFMRNLLCANTRLKYRIDLIILIDYFTWVLRQLFTCVIIRWCIQVFKRYFILVVVTLSFSCVCFCVLSRNLVDFT